MTCWQETKSKLTRKIRHVGNAKADRSAQHEKMIWSINRQII